MTFLTAEWRKLAMANYTVPDDWLLPHLPAGTELDRWAGSAYVSLIGFLFDRVRLLGVPVPWHTRFPEVNLRFYVRHRHAGEWRRGVVFVRELVPRPAVTWVANTVYGENYRTTRMRHRIDHGPDALRVAYDWRLGGRWQRFGLTADPTDRPLTAGSVEEFITEHYFGYTRHSPVRTSEYEVTHPAWDTYPVRDHTIDVDFAANYGDAFAPLTGRAPDSLLLAEGSPITVEGKRSL